MSNIHTYSSFFNGKSITLLGLGLLGRGVGDAKFLAQHCKKLFVVDLKAADELASSLEALKGFGNIEFHLGAPPPDELFRNVDFIVKGAGVRLDHHGINLAQKNAIPVYMSTALFARFTSLPMIGITGTRGKTTTTCMIADILQKAGKRVLLGGNIRGVSTLALLPEASNYDIAVLELDSWQLQGFDSLQISPHISIFTTFYPDHMNYYNDDMQLYLNDKTAIFRHQKSDDTLVVSENVAQVFDKKSIRPQGKFVVAQPLPDAFPLPVPGGHHLLNGGLARAAALACGIDKKTIEESLRHFVGVEGRMQRLGTWEGRAIYNDNNATTQEATVAAMSAFPPQSIVLIFGGADKDLPIDKMVDYIRTHKIRCVLLAGTGSDRVVKELPHIPVAHSMPDAVSTACKLSQNGDTIILSPAFASFGLFKNEYDRNDQFMDGMTKMINTAH